MFIQSKFKDYYDYAVMQYGIDKSIIYERKTEMHNINNNWIQDPDILGFCGKLYFIFNPFRINPMNTIIDYDIEIYRLTNRYYTDIEECRNWQIKENVNTILQKYDRNILSRIANMFIEYTTHKRKFRYIPIFNNKEIKTYLNLFEQYKTPIFYSHKAMVNELYINPNLEKLRFNNVMNPYQVSQEIDMFMRNNFGKQDPIMPVGDDKIIAESKGFDKHSFRKTK